MNPAQRLPCVALTPERSSGLEQPQRPVVPGQCLVRLFNQLVDMGHQVAGPSDTGPVTAGDRQSQRTVTESQRRWVVPAGPDRICQGAADIGFGQ